MLRCLCLLKGGLHRLVCRVVVVKLVLNEVVNRMDNHGGGFPEFFSEKVEERYFLSKNDPG